MEDWGKRLGDVAAVNAMLDRLVASRPCVEVRAGQNTLSRQCRKALPENDFSSRNNYCVLIRLLRWPASGDSRGDSHRTKRLIT